jgi:DNA-binding NtrC family response regulator
MTDYKKFTILYVDDEAENLDSFKLLFLNNYHVITAESGQKGLEIIENQRNSDQPVGLVLSDQRMPKMNGIEFLERIKSIDPDIIKILITGYSDIDVIADALNKVGIFHYINKPYETTYITNIINKGIETFNLRQENRKLIDDLRKSNSNLQNTNQELKQTLIELEELKKHLEEENIYLKEEIASENFSGEIITESPKIRQIFQEIRSVAKTDSTVLITGETGTGKELVARAIHENSNRSKSTLVKVNCAAIPANLIESELFGHEKGSFTGANARKIGKFELASGGTIFLDEIGELPLELQSKLLRILQESELERVGGNQTIKINIRVVAATNRNLLKEIDEGNFREDLYYRLHVFPINIPSLRERKEDIKVLSQYFVKKYCKKTGKKIEKIPAKVMEKLEKYDWPGNVRELENIIERAVIISSGNTLQMGDWIDSKKKNTIEDDQILTLEEIERNHIIKTLNYCNGVIHGSLGAAELLNINPSTLRSRMMKLGIKMKKKISEM